MNQDSNRWDNHVIMMGKAMKNTLPQTKSFDVF